MFECNAFAATVHEILANRDLGADEKIIEIESILHTPKRPTMVDMTKDEREACQWLQCDVEDEVIRAVIINPHWESGSARVLWEGAFIEQIDWERVTPRPDLPRFEWPDTDQEDEDTTPAKVGDVIESAADPRLAALPVGSILLDLHGDAVTKQSEGWVGLGYKPVEAQGERLGPWWKVAYIPKEDDQ